MDANGLADFHPMGTDDGLGEHLAANLRHLRDARGWTQEQLARVCGLPRATLANLESGVANPTLAVMHRVAEALGVSLEELVAAPRAETRFYPVDTLHERVQGQATVRQLLPDHLPSVTLDRIALPPHGRMTGAPHTPGTREYLTCETGTLVLSASGSSWTLGPGDVVVFRGDQRHAYANPGDGVAVGYSIVLLVPAEDTSR